MVSMTSLERLGRERLSPSFFLRDFLHSEIAQVSGLCNVPEDPDLAIEAGRGLCEQVLEPLQAVVGRIAVRSGYRSPAVNALGNEKNWNCAANDYNRARHIWDTRDAAGHLGATACIVVTSFVDYFERTGDWPALAYFVHDHVPAYRDMVFYGNYAAFNINWYQGPVTARVAKSQVPDPATGKKGTLFEIPANDTTRHEPRYAAWRAERG